MTYAMRFGSIIGISALVVFLDQLSKWWFMGHFAPGESRHLTSFFHLTLVFNTGSAFGLFQGNNKALLVMAFIILGCLVYSARGMTERGGLWGALGIALVVGGAIGNMIDRIRIGHVIDFLDFRIWPVFNIADSAITVGAVLLAIGLWKEQD